GHAMAAGLTLREADHMRFAEVFEEVVRESIDPASLTHRLETDGALESGWMSLASARMIEQDIWGQGFPAPMFDDCFRVENQRLLKDRHLKLQLTNHRCRYAAIRFNHAATATAEIRAAYRLSANDFNGITS